MLMTVTVGLQATTAVASAALRLQEIAGPGGTAADGTPKPFTSPGGRGPSYVASPPGDPHRLFVTTQDGYVYVIVDGQLRPTPFLDLHAKTDTHNENGLFSIAFRPDYATSGVFYVNYSDTSATDPISGAPSNLDRHTVVAYRRSATDPDRADPSTAKTILVVPSTGCTTMTSPHYGGQMAFGPDGKLWISIGDGGDGCNDRYRALDLDDLHGKIVRIDPNPAGGYSIPPDNPLADGSGDRQLVWAYGLRNPWRFSFDAGGSHDLVIGDVGNNSQEELDVVSSAPRTRPAYFGWPCVEGTVTYSDGHCTGIPDTPIAPRLTHTHGGGCESIIGGVVLRDQSLGGDFYGRTLFGYFCGGPFPGQLQTADLGAPTPSARSEGLSVGPYGLDSFGTDACNHPYAMNVTHGGLWRIEGDTPGPCGEFIAPETTLSGGPTGTTHDTSASFSASSTVRGSSYVCRLDGAEIACPASGAITLTGLRDGQHTLTVAARDEAGNTDATPEQRSWRVEAVAPQTTITEAPPATTASHTLRFAFSADEDATTFQCSLDYAPAQPCSSPQVYDGVADGQHTFLVAAIDAGGDVDPTPAEARITVGSSASPSTPVQPLAQPQVIGQGTPVARSASIGSTRIRASRTGVLTLSIRGGAKAGRARISAKAGRRTALRSRTVTVRARRTMHVHLRLTAAVRRTLAKRGKLVLTVRVHVAGGATKTRRVTVLAPNRPRRVS